MGIRTVLDHRPMVPVAKAEAGIWLIVPAMTVLTMMPPHVPVVVLVVVLVMVVTVAAVVALAMMIIVATMRITILTAVLRTVTGQCRCTDKQRNTK